MKATRSFPLVLSVMKPMERGTVRPIFEMPLETHLPGNFYPCPQ